MAKARQEPAEMRRGKKPLRLEQKKEINDRGKQNLDLKKRKGSEVKKKTHKCHLGMCVFRLSCE